MDILVFVDILQLPHTVISNSEKLAHPNEHTDGQVRQKKSVTLHNTYVQIQRVFSKINWRFF